jgi:type IX secretion system PorP/SprF family membrane protein
MKKIRLLIFTGFFLFQASNWIYAQQDAQFSQYMFNNVYYNPGFAGIDGLSKFTAIARQQYLGYQASIDKGGAPQSFVLTGSSLTPLLNKSVGVGINFLYDKLGPLTTTQAQISGSYLFRFKSSTIGAGFRAGILSQRVGADYRVNDLDDNIYQELQRRTGSQIKPDLTMGVVYRTPKFYFGLSFSHIVSNTYTFGIDSVESRLKNHMYITGAYNLDLGTLIQLTPSFLVQTDLQQLTYLFGAIATYNDKFWFGINARESLANRDVSQGGKTLSNDDIVFLVGVNLMKNKQNNNALKIGYAFDFVTSGVNAKSNTSQEILLSYIVIPPWDILKPKVRTPRYRHDEN